MIKKDRLFLHIGSHKTGTTTIQRWLHDRRGVLEGRGVSVVTAPPDANLHRLIGFVDPSSLVPMGQHLEHPDALAESFAKAQGPAVVASSENFSFFFQRRYVEALRDLLYASFREVTIVAYLRRQDSHAVSHHQEGSKPQRRAEEQLFGFSPSALPDPGPDLDLYLDYERRIGMWIDVFGRSNLVVRIFERDRLEGGNVQRDFARVIGVSDAGGFDGDRSNTSLGASRASMGHVMNEMRLSDTLKNRILSALPDDPPLLPSRDAARDFYERYRDGNIRLNTRLGNAPGQDLFSDDFSRYPATAMQAWPAEAGIPVIRSLLEQLAIYDDLTDADMMRDAALQAHKSGNGGKALRLIRMAAELRPNGEFILRKREEFEALYGGATTNDP